MIPKKSQVSRSCQLAAGYTLVTEGTCGSASGCTHLKADPPVVRDRHQVVHGVQLAAGLLRVVHAGHAGEDLEAQRRVVQHLVGHREQVLAVHVEGELAAVHHDPLDRLAENRFLPRSARRRAPGPPRRSNPP